MPKTDAYHNEFLNTEELLQQGFARELKNLGVDIETGAGGEKLTRDSGGMFFMRAEGRTGSMATTNENGRPVVAAGGLTDSFLDKTGALISEAKEIAISIFPSLAGEKGVSGDMERLIRALEKAESIYGIESEPFERLRHLSGLKAKNPLENAYRVMANTIDNYEAFIINDMKPMNVDGNPGVAITILGEIGEKGFVSKAVVTASPDFSGNEAIDYVHDGKDGMFTVKAFQKGRWVDVTDNFRLEHKTAEYTLEKDDKFAHSVFVGKKIVKEGKGIILENLKLDDVDVKFGDHQVFCKDAKTVEEIKRLITAKDQG
jgi:hypothetical protein